MAAGAVGALLAPHGEALPPPPGLCGLPVWGRGRAGGLRGLRAGAVTRRRHRGSFCVGDRYVGVPWTQGLFAQLELASRLAGTGVQVGLGAGVGFSWAFFPRVGGYAVLETTGWLTQPRALALGARGGVFVWF